VEKDLVVASTNPLILSDPAAPDWQNAMTVSTDRYYCHEIATREKERIFFRSWQLVGRAAQIPDPGDFFTIDLCGENILVVRQDDGTIRSYYNVCRHRGRRVVDEKSGNATSFRCAYHSWCYDRGGKLKSLPFAEIFTDFDSSQVSLESIHTDTFAGMIFVNLAANPIGLRDFLGPIQTLDGWFKPELVKSEATLPIDSNWKVIVENFVEFYHVPGLHTQRYSFFSLDEAAFVLFREHSFQIIPFATRAGWAKERSHNWHEWIATHDLANPSFAMHFYMFPNTTIHVNPHIGTVAFFQALPHPQDPRRSFFRYWKLLIGTKNPESFVEEVMQQDLDNMEPHGSGLASRSLQRVRFGSTECRVAHFHAALDRQMGGERTSTSAT
jgi:phenylpropionate dioxygenase-like ring-hydroxylating dioxygenase large terminal subunit